MNVEVNDFVCYGCSVAANKDSAEGEARREPVIELATISSPGRTREDIAELLKLCVPLIAGGFVLFGMVVAFIANALPVFTRGLAIGLCGGCVVVAAVLLRSRKLRVSLGDVFCRSLKPPARDYAVPCLFVAMSLSMAVAAPFTPTSRTTAPESKVVIVEPPKPKASVSFEYVRLFGFFQAISVLSPAFQTQNLLRGVSGVKVGAFESRTAMEEWRKTPYATYATVREPVLTTLPLAESYRPQADPEKWEDFLRILFHGQVSKGSRIYNRFYKLMNITGAWSDYTKQQDAELRNLTAWFEDRNQRIAMLILVVKFKNVESGIREPTIHYRSFSVECGEELPAKKADEELSSSDSDLELADPAISGDKLLIPLSVYEPDSKGYESKYLSYSIKPSTLTYKLDGKLVTQEIRPPLRDKAAKIALSFGWGGQ